MPILQKRKQVQKQSDFQDHIASMNQDMNLSL